MWNDSWGHRCRGEALEILLKVERCLESPSGKLFTEVQDLATRETLELARQQIAQAIVALQYRPGTGSRPELLCLMPEIRKSGEELPRLLTNPENGRATADAALDLLNYVAWIA